MSRTDDDLHENHLYASLQTSRCGYARILKYAPLDRNFTRVCRQKIYDERTKVENTTVAVPEQNLCFLFRYLRYKHQQHYQ